ncbi:L-piperidine-6-carboxylate dehydrogenase [Seonamhaeicola maritimus]|uniref:aldehyde dehydrogenase (NAD(+)) n=1 Tax=Seonamhaeicola maritimus TaxID=2591822 RepID=A0A5C7GMB5_9FLAO|nr:aldehyde dehydrogenase family protein [Seonamhaeicola maritimus]TXG39061.1 aldehyde dehydrogenase family protein [Seonamhaeicola maritimus]
MKNLLNPFNLSAPFNNSSSGLSGWISKSDKVITINSPVDNLPIGEVELTNEEGYKTLVSKAQEAFPIWKAMPAPKRGEIVRQFGDALRIEKENLGKLVSYEMGKSLQEGYGEVQEMIDICDFAVGLSRQLYGLQMHSERPNHRMFEQWHPLGIVGIISAFNFPVAVWAWNSALSWVCGNVCLWKPSEKTPFSALACQEIFKKVLKKNNLPEGISNVIIGDSDIGKLMASDPNIALVSATGSTRMGKSVAETVGKRLGKSILELGGNNAIIVTEKADLDTAIAPIVFGAVGTAGQRCTTTRRLIVHKSLYKGLLNKLVNAYKQLRIGDPLNENNHVGPLIDSQAVDAYLKTINEAQKQGGNLAYGNEVLKGSEYKSNCYVKPTIIEANIDMPIVKHETFAPILYVFSYETLEEAITIQNNVPQGLSSAIFSMNMQQAEMFLSHAGSDCGIANVNIGTSGAEIGGAFGGEKETGGGRESGSDSWKAYMRRQTCTVNYGNEGSLAQGIKFNL